ncbi:unnamed protein product [Periconia digitata]|uniref:Uncharacterized protein n=1 Tax=Periconia digitata TaxID=1303443 RepID=A0A9W4U3L5_9PLEO|nr:unnamed protein product [Periconia digitata]
MNKLSVVRAAYKVSGPSSLSSATWCFSTTIGGGAGCRASSIILLMVASEGICFGFFTQVFVSVSPNRLMISVNSCEFVSSSMPLNIAVNSFKSIPGSGMALNICFTGSGLTEIPH